MMAILAQFTRLLSTVKAGEEIILNFQDARKLKTALESHLKTPRVRAAGPKPAPATVKAPGRTRRGWTNAAREKAIKKENQRKQNLIVDDPFKDIQIDENPDLDEKLYETVYGPKKKNYRRGPVKQAGKRDKMSRIIADMIIHINDMIKRGDMSLQEYLNDPDVYLDSRIMGNYIKAPIMKKAIERHFKRMAGI